MYTIGSKEIITFTALIRWYAPNRKLIPAFLSEAHRKSSDKSGETLANEWQSRHHSLRQIECK